MSYNLEEYEIVLKASNLRQAKNLVKINQISYNNLDPNYSREIENMKLKQHVAKQTQEHKY